MHELSTDSEVTFRKVLGSTKILPTRPGVDPLEVTRPMPDLSDVSQSPMTASPFVIARSQSGSVPSSASYVFGPQPEGWSTPDPTRTDPARLHFTNTVVNIWNFLPSYIISAKTVNCFKSKLDNFWKNQDIIYDYQSYIHGTGNRSEIVVR